MSYWIFKCNVSKYLLQRRMADPEPRISWRVDPCFEHQIKAGDTAFIWETGRTGGIRANMQVDSAPARIEELETEKQYYVDLDNAPPLRVLGRLQERNLSLDVKAMKSTSGLEKLSVFAGNGYHTRNTTYPITDLEAALIENMIKPQG